TGEAFPVLVPQVDADGNERDGVRLPQISVPLATDLSWNLRDASIGAPSERVSFEASYIAVPKTAAERAQYGDPRKCIGERYGSRDAYLAQIRQVVGALVKQHWILEEDRAQVIRDAERDWDDATK